MELLFWLSLGLIAYGYLLYPLGVAVMGSLARCVNRKDDGYLPAVSLIISAYNEECVIDEKLRNTLTLDYPKDRIEIIVASESTDRTNEIAARYVNRGVRLQAFSERRGKPATIYRVMPTVHGDVVVFSDANAMYRPDAVRKLVRNFADPSVGCVIGRMEYINHAQTIGSQGEGFYWKYDIWLRKHANRLRGLVPGINGTIFAIRKALYLPYSEDRGDDYELCTRIVIHGHAAVFESDAVAEEQASETTLQQFKRKSRLARWNAVSSVFLLKEAVRFGRLGVVLQVLSHRLLRYVMPVWLVMSFVSAGMLARHSSLYAAAFLTQVAFYFLALAGLAADAIGLRLPPVCLIPSYFLMVNSAAVAGLAAGVTRGQVTTWQKTR